MCGITGIVLNRGSKASVEAVHAMNDAIAHRGPDAEGVYISDNIALGHRRLSIIDTSDAGNQPFFGDNKRIVVVFNGEIYNYIELKKQLENDYSFATGSDTEVIIAAYKKWGIKCVEHFIGMFAFALHDPDADMLMIARDRLGIKPIYLAQVKNGFLFASEIRALLQSNLVERKLNKKALTDFLRYQTVHAPQTIIQGIEMLMPGHILTWQNEHLSKHCYWKPSDHSGLLNNISREEAKREVKSLLTSAVELRMRADVPFGAFLSGGIDSSIVVGLMAEQSERAIETFSITFHEREFDESPYSDLIAKRFNTNHHPIRLSANDFLDKIPAALEAMDHPSGDGPNTFVVSEVTRKHGVKMALSGLGGDELFAGYDVFKRLFALEEKKWLNATPHIIRSLAGATLQKFKPSVASEKLKEFLSADQLDMALAYKLSRQVWMDDSIKHLLGKNMCLENVVTDIYRKTETMSGGILSRVSIAEIESYMQNVLLRDTDQMSMSHALEIRVPFLDHRLVEYVLGLNDAVKFPHTPKQLLVESMAGILPSEIVDRPKMGFTFPWTLWMKGELKDYCESGLEVVRNVSAFDEQMIDKVWMLFLQGDKTFTWSRIWPLVVLGHWIKQNDIHE